MFALGLLFSCIDNVDDVNLPRVDPKLVVQSFIGPNDSLIVTVKASRPINYNVPTTGGWSSDEYVVITDATVTIKNTKTNEGVTLPYISSIGKYAITANEFSVENDEEYSLSVSANGYKSVSASTKVPNSYSVVSEITFDTLSVNQYGDRTIIASGFISDSPGEVNYYSVTLYQLSTYNWSGTDETYINFFSRVLLTDKGKDGEDLSFKIEMWDYQSDDKKIYIYVHSTDEHFYRFHKSLENIEDYMDNPFAESSIMYSNVEGGLGVFASQLHLITIISQK